MKRVTILVMSLALLVIAGCSDVGYKKTKSGLMYKILSDGSAPQLKRGDWMKIHIRQLLNDSLLAETYGQRAAYIRMDSFPANYDPSEVLSMLRKGDSAVVVMPGDSILRRSGQLPDFMKRKDKFIVTFKVLDVYTSDSAKVADETKENDGFLAKQKVEEESKRTTTVKEIEDYLAENKVNFQKAAGGTYVVVDNPGSQPLADTGFVASVKYKGYLFKTDKVFDQNMDGAKPPYPVTIGTAGVVKGWEEGLCYFGKGGKGKLYVPFWQGYGARGPMNTPYATMVFDIEIADLQPAAAQPQMPPGFEPPPARQ